MKIFNPNYVAPDRAKAQQLAALLETYFTDNPGVAGVTVDQIKAALPAAQRPFVTDGMVSQICNEKGWKFEL